jgi:hypothetical protein
VVPPYDGAIAAMAAIRAGTSPTQHTEVSISAYIDAD